MKNIITRWGLAFGWVGFIYATLGVARSFTNALRGFGILNLTIECGYIAILGVCLFILVRSKNTEWWRYMALGAVLSSYYFFAKGIPSPEEKIHFFEYGLVGILFYKAVQNHIQIKWLIFLSALLLGGLAGWVDELIQKILPNRYYDPRDIALNAISVALGLVVLLIYPDEHPQKKIRTNVSLEKLTLPRTLLSDDDSAKPL